MVMGLENRHASEGERWKCHLSTQAHCERLACSHLIPPIDANCLAATANNKWLKANDTIYRISKIPRSPRGNIFQQNGFCVWLTRFMFEFGWLTLLTSVRNLADMMLIHQCDISQKTDIGSYQTSFKFSDKTRRWNAVHSAPVLPPCMNRWLLFTLQLSRLILNE